MDTFFWGNLILWLVGVAIALAIQYWLISSAVFGGMRRFRAWENYHKNRANF